MELFDDGELAGLRAAAAGAAVMTWNLYSNYTVLAAIETVDGRFYGGSNVENTPSYLKPINSLDHLFAGSREVPYA